MRISLGKFIPSDSHVHGLDPRQKILSSISIVIAVMMCDTSPEYIAPASLVALYILLSGVRLKIYLKGLKSIWMILAFAVIVQLMVEGISGAVYISLRFILILMVGEILTYTTPPTALSSAMEDVMRWMGFSRALSQEFSMVMGIAIRFAPILLDEADRIFKAQISRGAPLDSKRPLERLKALTSVVIPLMSSAVRKSEELAIAMEARRYQPGTKRTRYARLEWRARDSFHLIMCLSIVAITLIIR